MPRLFFHKQGCIVIKWNSPLALPSTSLQIEHVMVLCHSNQASLCMHMLTVLVLIDTVSEPQMSNRDYHKTSVMQKTMIDCTVNRSELLNQLEATDHTDINLWQGNGCYILNQIEALSNGLYVLQRLSAPQQHPRFSQDTTAPGLWVSKSRRDLGLSLLD